VKSKIGQVAECEARKRITNSKSSTSLLFSVVKKYANAYTLIITDFPPNSTLCVAKQEDRQHKQNLPFCNQPCGRNFDLLILSLLE
jgi:hypothetical protein